MWKKESDQSDDQGLQSPVRAASPPSSPSAARQPERRAGGRATIGPSIIIKGDVSGEEDLVIEGRIEGTVDLGQYTVTIGPEGRVNADVSGRSVTVEGEVRGNLTGQEQIVLRTSARVEGDIAAPRVTVEDGAMFRGSIDMGTRDSHRAGPGRRDSVSGTPPSPRPGSAAMDAAAKKDASAAEEKADEAGGSPS